MVIGLGIVLIVLGLISPWTSSTSTRLPWTLERSAGSCSLRECSPLLFRSW